MSYPGDDNDDETDDYGMPAASSGFAVNNSAPVSPADALARFSALQPQLNASNALRRADLQKNVIDPQAAAYDKYGEYLKNRRTGNDTSQNLYSIGAALLQPTTGRGLAGTIANLAPALAKQHEASRAAEQERADMMAKYNLQRSESDVSGQKALLDVGKTDNALLLKYAMAGGRPPTIPTLIQYAKFAFPDDPVKQQAFVAANAPAAIAMDRAPKVKKPSGIPGVPDTHPADLPGQ